MGPPSNDLLLKRLQLHPANRFGFAQRREYITDTDANLLDQSIDQYFGIAWLTIDTKVLWTCGEEGCMLRNCHSKDEKRVASYS
jgi:hypothetical protein